MVVKFRLIVDNSKIFLLSDANPEQDTYVARPGTTFSNVTTKVYGIKAHHNNGYLLFYR